MTVGVQTPPPGVRLLTAEEYGVMPDDGRRTELVNGEVIDVPSPSSEHGYVCVNVGSELRAYVRSRDLGRVVGNDSGVITSRDPDSMRGLDVGFYSYDRVPRGVRPKGYWPAPELVFEVKSPSDRTRGTLAKIAEYHKAGVRVVCVIDPEAGTADVHPADQPPRRYTGDEAIELPELFPDFSVPVRALLE